MDTTVLFTTIVVAVAGPIGITLGWWLGKRSERDRVEREERKSAYAAFTGAAIRYRNSDDSERVRRRNERWEAFAVLTLVAPPELIRSAAHLVAGGDQLLDPSLDEERRRAIYVEMWSQIGRFTQLACANLQVGVDDAFAALTPVIGERLTFERPEPTSAGSREEPDSL